MSARDTFLVELGYDGSRFHGVARQPGFPTVAGAFAAWVEQVVGSAPRGVSFAARTDAGVSAEQNFATFWVRGVSDPEACAARLLASARGEWSRERGSPGWVRSVCRVPRSVQARNCATEKHYRYLVYDAGARPEREGTAWCVVPSLREDWMQRAGSQLVGQFDFSSFRAVRCDAKNPVRTISSLTVDRVGRAVAIDVVGDGFLRKMVRIIVGTLAEFGAGLRAPDEMKDVLMARQRRAAGLTAPAHGLCLERVGLAELAMGAEAVQPGPASHT